MNLQQKLDNKILELNEQHKNRERSGKFNASNLGKCFKAQFLDRMNAEKKPLELSVLHSFHAGHIIEEYIQNMLYGEKVETKIEDDDFIGYPDLVTKNAVKDIKSTNGAYLFFNGWNAKSGELNEDQINERIKEKKIHNILQTSFYADSLDKELIGLVFIAKDLSYGLKAHEFTAKLDDYRDLLLEEKDQLRNYWYKQEMPNGKARLFNGKECQYCAFYGVSCKGEDK